MTYNPRITNQQNGTIAISGNLIIEGNGLITASNLTCDSVTSSNIVGGDLIISSSDYQQTETIKTSVIKTSTNLTLTSGHHTVLVEPTSSNVTITLPYALYHLGREYIIKKNISSSYSVTVSASSGAERTDKIDSSSTASLASSYQSVHVISDGTGSWYII